ncbi:MAG: alpha/beta hydrolase [Pseudomonadota bacterium]
MAQATDFSISSGSAALAARRVGSGQPLICLHAGVGDLRMFAGQMGPLGEQMEVFAYDRRGFGKTLTPNEPFSHVDDLLAVIDAIGGPPSILLGCSQGGRIAIDLALAFPGRVAALILIGTAISGAPAEPIPDYVKGLASELEEAEDAEDVDRINPLDARIWLDGPTSPEGRVSGPLRELFLDMNRIALEHAELDQRREPPDAFNRLAEISVPVLLMHGSLDFHYIIDRHAHLATVFPDAETAILEGAAHLPTMEMPDRVNDRILDFCRRRRLVG